MVVAVKQYKRCPSISEKAKKTMKRMALDSQKQNRELGAVLCEQGGKLEIGATCSGDECHIEGWKFLTPCEKAPFGKGLRAGTFHTHVDDLPIASDADLDITYRSKDSVLLVGGIRRYPRKRARVRAYYNLRPAFSEVFPNYGSYESSICEVV